AARSLCSHVGRPGMIFALALIFSAYYFFFQAEDGIRDFHVTGVQTCALPISALQALSTLTREADASQKWRIVGWLSVIFIPFLAGAMLNNASNVLAVAVLDLEPNLLLIGLAKIGRASCRGRVAVAGVGGRGCG